MKKKKNYLDYVPVKNEDNQWITSGDGKVLIKVINKGFFNKIAQVLFKTPRESEIQLDQYGSVVWLNIDDKRNIGEIADEVRSSFTEDSEEIFYERLIKFFHILKNNKYVKYI